MRLPPTDEAPNLRPLGPMRLAIVAFLIPAMSLIGSLALTLAGLHVLGFGGTEDILARLAADTSGDPAGEAAIEAMNLAFEALLLAFTFTFVWARSRSWKTDVFAWTPWPKDRSALPFLGLMLAWLALRSFLIDPRFPQVSEYAQLPVSQPALLLSLVSFTTVLPFAEEMFYRGFLYSNLRAYAGFPLTIIVTALYFSALHYQDSFVLPVLTLPFGLIMGLVRERYHSVKPAIYFHMIWNLIGWGSGYFL